EPIGGAMTELVVAERSEQRRFACEPRELDGGHGAASRRRLPSVDHVGDLSRRRQVRHPQELRPLDVTYDRQAEPGERFAERGFEVVTSEHAVRYHVWERGESNPRAFSGAGPKVARTTNGSRSHVSFMSSG